MLAYQCHHWPHFIIYNETPAHALRRIESRVKGLVRWNGPV